MVIPSIERPSLGRAVDSVYENGLDWVVEYDRDRTGAGATRNRAISRVDSEWVGFLDDDDHLAPGYKQAWEEMLAKYPDCDVVIFRLKRPHGYQGMWPDKILPRFPELIRGNVGINFACRTELAKEFPFTEDKHHQDSIFLETLDEAGARIVYSPRIVYLVRDAQA